MLETSILKTIKKPLNVSADDDAFDQDIILFINSELYTLRQLGVDGLIPMIVVDENTTWSEMFGPDTELLQAVKDFIYTGAKIKFDPPDSVPALNSLKDSKQELGWRIVER